MKEWFEALEKREQHLVLLLSGVVMVAVVYFMLYQPLADNLANAKQGVVREQQLLNWVDKNAAKIVRLRATSGVSANTNSGSLEQVVNSTARRYKLTINRLQPQSNRLQVTIENAPFTQLLQWVQELQLNYGVMFEIAEFRPQGQPGFVKTRLVVSK